MSTRVGVVVMAAALLLYIVLVGQRAWLLVASGDGVGIAMGIALLVLPAVAVWGLGREISFGVRADALGRRLDAEGGLPSEQLDVKASGAPIRDEAAALFPVYRDAVAQHPDDWRAWYRLGLVYDGSGDRRRARHAVRTAISLERAESR